MKTRVPRIVALFVGLTLFSLAIDSAIGHFAGKSADNPLQLAPVMIGLIGGMLLSVAAHPGLPLKVFRVLVRVVGGPAVLAGAAGVGYHGRALWMDLADEALSVASLEGVLSVGPPLLAPAAFLGVGMLLWALGSPSLHVFWQPGRVEGAVAPPLGRTSFASPGRIAPVAPAPMVTRAGRL
jgi:hypothetical protein